jgi:hypothetical protein
MLLQKLEFTIPLAKPITNHIGNPIMHAIPTPAFRALQNGLRRFSVRLRQQMGDHQTVVARMIGALEKFEGGRKQGAEDSATKPAEMSDARSFRSHHRCATVF